VPAGQIRLTGPQVAQLVIEAGFPEQDRVTMVAIAKAESGWTVDAINTSNSNGSIDRGLFQINSVHSQYNAAQLLSDPRYNTMAAKAIYDGQGLKAWSTYNADRQLPYMAESGQAVANAGGLTGAPAVPGSDPASQTVVYGPPGSEETRAGKGIALDFSTPTATGALGEIEVVGQQIGANIGLQVIGEPAFRAGLDVIPHVSFSVIDPNFGWSNQRLFDSGNLITWRDAYLRVDTATYVPGDHGQGEADVVAEDDIVHALRHLRGPKTESNIDAVTWLFQEMSTVGYDPARFLLGESVPSQSTISRDVWDPAQGVVAEAEYPSAWTTVLRLAKELGKWCFISGRRIIFGSARFSMAWAAPAPVYLGWDKAPPEEQMVDIPTTVRATIAERVMILQVKCRVPHARANLFRPGVPVNVYGVMGTSATRANPHLMMVTDVEHVLATDTDGADVTLIEPVDPPPHPPGSTNDPNKNPATAGAAGISGGGADGQVETFVRNALSQTGKAYVYGAQPSATDPNPRSFDCSALVQWSATRAGIGGVPRTSEAQFGASDQISADTAIGIRGALLFPADLSHVAISLGNGSTIEASNESRPVGQLNARGRGFTHGGKLRGAKGYA
jgi:cell wall-associated NlpC family hydrolase